MTDAARRDGALAALALLACAGALWRLETVPAPLPALGGALATVLFEAVAGRYHGRVRRLWERPAVRALCLLAALSVAVASAFLDAGRVASAATGALAAYLCLLALVTRRVLAPPRRWWVDEER